MVETTTKKESKSKCAQEERAFLDRLQCYGMDKDVLLDARLKINRHRFDFATYDILFISKK